MQSETLAQEFARLVKEYHEGDDQTKPEAWNLLADYAVDNADAISRALSDKQAGEVKGGALAVQTQQGVEEEAPYTRVVGKPTIAVGTYTITELYAGRAVESDFMIMAPADDLTILMDGAEQQLARPLKITDSVILAACRAHTPQFDRLDAEIARYAKDQMREALTAALKVMEISR